MLVLGDVVVPVDFEPASYHALAYGPGARRRLRRAAPPAARARRCVRTSRRHRGSALGLSAAEKLQRDRGPRTPERPADSRRSRGRRPPRRQVVAEPGDGDRCVSRAGLSQCHCDGYAQPPRQADGQRDRQRGRAGCPHGIVPGDGHAAAPPGSSDPLGARVEGRSGNRGVAPASPTTPVSAERRPPMNPANLRRSVDLRVGKSSSRSVDLRVGTFGAAVEQLTSSESRVDDVFWVCHHPVLAPHVKVLACAECRTCPLWNPASRYPARIPSRDARGCRRCDAHCRFSCSRVW